MIASPRHVGLTAAATSMVLVATILSVPQTASAASPNVSKSSDVTRSALDDMSAPNALAARIEAQARGWRVEVLDERTEDATTWANADGTFTTENASGPIRVKDANEDTGWRELDYELTRNSDGTVSPKSPYLPIVLAGESTAIEAKRQGLVSVETKRGKEIAFGWDGALPEPVLDDTKATYENVLPSTDLVVELTATGYEQFFVVKKAPIEGEDLEYRLPLGIDGLSAEELNSGAIELSDSRDRLVGTIPTPFMWDASEVAGSGEPRYMEELDMRLGEGPGETQELILTPDPLFFDNPNLTYPIIIDPSVTPQNPTWDAYVRSDNPTVNYVSDDELLVGTFNSGTTKARSFLSFSAAAWRDTVVTSSTLKLYLDHSWNCTPSSFTVYAAGLGSTSTTSWNNQPSVNGTYKTSFSAAKGYNSVCGAGWVSVPVTDVVAYLARRDDATVGLSLRASESSSTGWKRFFSGNHTSLKPTLSVTYNRYPTTASVPTLAPATTGAGTSADVYTVSQRPSFSSKTTDSDGYSTKVKFEAWTAQAGGTLAATCTSSAVASGTAASCQPETNLSNDTFYLRARGYDGVTWSQQWSPMTPFTVASTPPPPPLITCPSPHSNGSWGTNAPPAPVICKIGIGSGAPTTARIVVKVDSETSTFMLTPGQASEFDVAVPNSDGQHEISAQSVGLAGLNSTSTYSLGYGAASLTSPSSGIRTTDLVEISGAGHPAGTATATATLEWRLAGSESSGWNTASWVPTAIVGDGSKPVRVDRGVWSTLSAEVDITSGTAITLATEVPALLEVQLCFLYTPGGRQCSATESAPTQVLRVPHAFGGEYPVDQAGQGRVALTTGELQLEVTDVNVVASGTDISVGRVHSTFQGPETSATSVFGEGWAASFGGSAGVATSQVVDQTSIDGTLSLLGSDGAAMVFQQPGGTTDASPAGIYEFIGEDDGLRGASLEVTADGSMKHLAFKTLDGVTTRWKLNDTDPANPQWIPLSVVESGNDGETTFSSDAMGRVTRILGPVDTGLNCDDQLVRGCAAIHVSYWSSTSANSTTAGAYTGRVKQLAYERFDPLSGEMKSSTVTSYTYDHNGRLHEVTNALRGESTRYEYEVFQGNTAITAVTPSTSAASHYTYEASGDHRVLSYSLQGATSSQPTAVLRSYVYDVPVNHPGTPELSVAEVQKWGQASAPARGFAVFGPDHPAPSPAYGDLVEQDWPYASMVYTDSIGRTVNTAKFGAGRWLTSASLFGESKDEALYLTASDVEDAKQAYVNGLAYLPQNDRAVTRFNAAILDSTTGVEIVPAGSYVIDEWSEPRWSVLNDSTTAFVRIHTHYEYDEGAPNGGIDPESDRPYMFNTTKRTGATLAGNVSTDPLAVLLPDIETYNHTKYGYDPIDSGDPNSQTSGWVIGGATTTTTVMPSPAVDITRSVKYDANGAEILSLDPGSNGQDAGALVTQLYTTQAQDTHPECGGHPEWAGLFCKSYQAAEPTSGHDIPDLHVAGYDSWLSPTRVIESSGSGTSTVTRTTTTRYLEDGRPDSVELTVEGLTTSVPVKATKNLYSSATGVQTGVASLVDGEVVNQVSWAHDAWGRIVEYKDTLDEVTTTSYVPPGQPGAGHTSSVVDSKGTTTYEWDQEDADGSVEHRGLLTRMSVTGLGEFRAAYNDNDQLATQLLPGGIVQEHTYDEADRLSGLSYNGHSAGAPGSSTWLSFSQEFDALNRVAVLRSPTTSLDGHLSDIYRYDHAGRLSNVVEVTEGVDEIQTCESRGYDFDERGNRTKLTRVSGICGEGTATEQTWQYDNLSRQISGANGAGAYVYDELGRQVSIPAADLSSPDAGAALVSYSDDDTVSSIQRGGDTWAYTVDSQGRKLREVRSGGAAQTSVEKHYGDATDNPSWAVEVEGDTETISRYSSTISTLGRGIVTVSGANSVAQLGLSDLQGNLVTTVDVSGSGDAMTIGGYSRPDEFGNSRTEVADTGVVQYGWLGHAERAVLDSGLMEMGSRVYNSVTGRFTSPDSVRGGNENSYTYPGDPINTSDVSGNLAIVDDIALLIFFAVLATVALVIWFQTVPYGRVWYPPQIGSIRVGVTLGAESYADTQAKAYSLSIPWPNTAARYYQQRAKYWVYQICGDSKCYRDKTSNVYKYGITRVGPTRATSQYKKCNNNYDQFSGCSHIILYKNVNGYFNARVIEAALIVSYTIKHKHCPWGQYYSCK